MNRDPHLTINAIQRFCLQDGPGIRSTVFLQGCPLHCWWCHNAALQPASSADAQERRIDDLRVELERDARYWIRSGGGVTLSGGEPLRQAESCAVLLSAMGELGYHRCVETAGAAGADQVAALIEHVDLWLFDLKTVNARLFHEATGGNIDQVLANLDSILRRRPEAVWLRIPLIRGFNDDPQSIQGFRVFLATLKGIARVQLLPGHDLGASHQCHPAVDAATCRRAQAVLTESHENVEVCW